MDSIRRWIQGIFALVINANWAFPFTRTIYQGPMKVLCSPGLNCYSCPASTTYCPIGSLQSLLGGIRLAMANGEHFFGITVLGTMGLIGAMLGRMACGWLCPFGFFQELLHRIPSRKFPIPRALNYGKYAVLFGVVVAMPLLLVDEFGGSSPYFCKFICPAGTLEAGIPLLLMQPNLRTTVGLLFSNKLAILLLMIGLSIVASRPFCRTLCPLGAFYGLFSRFRLVKLRLDPGRCTNCKACHQVCPMGVQFNENPDDAECISCLACMNKACRFDAICLEVGGIPLRAIPRYGTTASEPSR